MNPTTLLRDFSDQAKGLIEAGSKHTKKGLAHTKKGLATATLVGASFLPTTANAQDGNVRLVSDTSRNNGSEIAKAPDMSINDILNSIGTLEKNSKTNKTTSPVLKDAAYEARLQSIIDNATKAGVLKSRDDFSNTFVVAGKSISQPNEEAYNAYVEDLKTRTREAFPDNAGKFSSLLSAIYSLGNGFNEINTPQIIDKTSIKDVASRLLQNNINLNKLREDLAHVTYNQANNNLPEAKSDLNDLLAGKNIFYIANRN
jgi:hypothetical protein